jgi:uncharacterized protein (TIGR02594 family)
LETVSTLTLYDLAQRFVGLAELTGGKNNGFIQWAHSLCGLDPETPDEVPWCSSFLNALAWIMRLPRSKSAAARSWLEVGLPVPLPQAVIGDVVIFTRGAPPQPGPEVTRGAPGHVALYAGMDNTSVLALGGNQGDKVSIARFPAIDVLGVRRLT